MIDRKMLDSMRVALIRHRLMYTDSKELAEMVDPCLGELLALAEVALQIRQVYTSLEARGVVVEGSTLGGVALRAMQSFDELLEVSEQARARDRAGKPDWIVVGSRFRWLGEGGGEWEVTEVLVGDAPGLLAKPVGADLEWTRTHRMSFATAPRDLLYLQPVSGGGKG